MKKYKIASRLLATVLMVTSVLPFGAAEAVTTGAHLAVRSIDRVGVGSLQTVAINMLDQNGQTVTNGSDQIALKIGSHSGLVRVYDANGQQLKVDDNGAFEVTANAGVATYQVSDTSAESIVYNFSDLTDGSVKGGAAVGYFSTVSKYVFKKTPFAPTGNLDAGTTTQVVLTTADRNGAGIENSSVYLSFVPVAGGGTASVNGQTLTTTPQKFTADSNGLVTIDYTTPGTLPNGGSDKFVAQNTLYAPTITSSSTYTFDSIVKFGTGSSGTIATSGSLNAGQVIDCNITAKDKAGIPMGNTNVYLSFKPTLNGGSASVNGVDLTADPQPFPTDANGNVTVAYTAPGSLPNGGSDYVSVQDSVNTPKAKATYSYTFARGARYLMVPSVMAPSGSLKAGQTTQFAMTVLDSTSKPMKNASVYLSLSQATGSDGAASVNGVPLSNDPQVFVTNDIGQVVVQYTAPSAMPNGGADKVIAQDAYTHPSITGSNSYTFATVSRYDMAFTPLAKTGSLKPGDSVVATVTAIGNNGKPIPNALVYLSITNPTGNGGTADVNGQPFADVPTSFVTGDSGQLDITYKAPAEMTSGGADKIKVQDDAVKPRISNTDTYTYQTITQLLPSSTMIAPTGTLNNGEVTAVAFTALDAKKNPVPNTDVFLSFAQVANGGTADVGGTALGNTVQKFVTNADGQVIVNYTAPATMPSGGTDQITIQDAPSAGHRTSIGYTFAQVANFVWNDKVIAPTGTLGAAASQTVTVVAVDKYGNPLANTYVYLSFLPTIGGGSASVNETALNGSYQQFVTGPDGSLAITYTAPANLPSRGMDKIQIADLANGAHVTKFDSYSFH